MINQSNVFVEMVQAHKAPWLDFVEDRLLPSSSAHVIIQLLPPFQRLPSTENLENQLISFSRE